MSVNVKYTAHAEGDSAELAIDGRASYLNCMNLPAFFEKLVEGGCKNLSIECKNCQSMDSTVLGIIAGVALKFRHFNPPGKVFLLNPNLRVSELLENLGLHKILEVVSSQTEFSAPKTEVPGDAASAKHILEAHENLIKADSTNKPKFQDIISFLKKESGEG